MVCRMTVPNCNGSGSTKDDSDPIVVTVRPVLNPSITVETANTSVCKNSVVSFKANVLDAGANPSFQWKVNGVDAGTNNSVFFDK